MHGVYNCYRFSGDRDAVKALMPTIERVLRWYAPYQTRAGVLKDVIEWNLVDWSSVSVAKTQARVLTALWARGLREFAEMAGGWRSAAASAGPTGCTSSHEPASRSSGTKRAAPMWITSWTACGGRR